MAVENKKLREYDGNNMLNLIKKICIQINYTDTTDIINIIKKIKSKNCVI